MRYAHILERLISNLRAQPEPVRRQVVIFATGIVGVALICLWMVSFHLTTRAPFSSDISTSIEFEQGSAAQQRSLRQKLPSLRVLLKKAVTYLNHPNHQP